MHIVVAMDSFKGSLSSLEAGRAVMEAAVAADGTNRVTLCPLADGGEGTVEALIAGMGGALVNVTVTGPLGQPVEAAYGILPDRTAVMEMSAAAGLPLVPPSKRDPMNTTTYGVGEMIAHAIDCGCRDFIMGIGGSATNDGGTGMLSALGFRFLDSKGAPIAPGAKGLQDLAAISKEGALSQLAECRFRVACDVKNPLCGDDGCSAIFAPQKGAKPEDISQMDSWLAGYARLAGGDPEYPGAGAAGGLGFGFLSFLNASLESGIRIVLEKTDLERHIQTADLVITGEGRLDGQSAMGKAPVGVAQLAKKYQKRVIAFAGCLGKDAHLCKEYGIDDFYAVTPGDMALEEAMKREIAYENLKRTARQVLGQSL